MLRMSARTESAIMSLLALESHRKQISNVLICCTSTTDMIYAIQV